MTGKPKDLKCDKCFYTWIYKGNKTKFVTCPDCMGKVDITKCEVRRSKSK